MTRKARKPRTAARQGAKFSVPDGAFERLWNEGWHFPLRLHRARSFAHWTQADLARAAGLSEQTVSDVLSGNRQVSFLTAGALIRAFHFAPAWQIHLLYSLVETGLDIGGFEEDGRRIESNLSMEHATGELDMGRGNWREFQLQQWAMPAIRRPSFPPADIPLTAPDRELEDWQSEFDRLTKLAGIGYFCDPNQIRNDPARDQYVERVLRPFARVSPDAAWALAYWLSTVLHYGGERSVWSFYRIVRRGHIPDALDKPRLGYSPRGPGMSHVKGYVEGKRVCRDCDHELPKNRWTKLRCAKCATSLRLSRPRKVQTDESQRLERPLTRRENPAILTWNVGREWSVSDRIPVDEEVDATLKTAMQQETALSEGHQLLIDQGIFREPL